MKKELGQFFTTNSEFILDGFAIPNTKIIDPFAGKLDLFADKLNLFAGKLNSSNNYEFYDKDKKLVSELVKYRDSLIDPPNYKGKFLLTNPPYLSKNKNKNLGKILNTDNANIFKLYNQDDLYKCFISSLLNNKPDAGIIIIPSNFWFSMRSKDIKLRKNFLLKFEITLLKIFEISVFDDTNIPVCAFSFEIRKTKNFLIPTIIIKNKTKIQNNQTKILNYVDANINLILNFSNFSIFTEIYDFKIPSNIIISRATSKNPLNTNIEVKCIDDKKKISAYITNNPFVDKTKNLSARSYIGLVLLINNQNVELELQKKLCENFNKFLNEKREEYNSMFLVNFREGTRKRISFEMIYKIFSLILN